MAGKGRHRGVRRDGKKRGPEYGRERYIGKGKHPGNYPPKRPPSNALSSLGVSPRSLRAAILVAILTLVVGPRLAAQEVHHTAWEWSFHGLAIMNGFYNDGKVNNSDLPLGVLAPDTLPGLPNHSLGATARQTNTSQPRSVQPRARRSS